MPAEKPPILAGAFAIAVVYPAAFALLNPASAAVVVVVAHLCKRLAAPAIDALGMGVNALLLTYALPVVMAVCLCLVVRFKKQPPTRMAKGANPPASFWLLLVTAGLAIAVGDEGGTGVWSLAEAGAGQGFLGLAAVAALALVGIAGLRLLSQAPPSGPGSCRSCSSPHSPPCSQACPAKSPPASPMRPRPSIMEPHG